MFGFKNFFNSRQSHARSKPVSWPVELSEIALMLHDAILDDDAEHVNKLSKMFATTLDKLLGIYASEWSRNSMASIVVSHPSRDMINSYLKLKAQLDVARQPVRKLKKLLESEPKYHNDEIMATINKFSDVKMWLEKTVLGGVEQHIPHDRWRKR